MVHTAIIAFGLIFLMFFLKECGNKEVTENVDTTKKVEAKVETNKEIETKEVNISKDGKVLTLIKPEIALEKKKVPIEEVELILNDEEKQKIVMDVVSQTELESQNINKEDKEALKSKVIAEIKPELTVQLLTIEQTKAKELAVQKDKAEKLAKIEEEEQQEEAKAEAVIVTSDEIAKVETKAKADEITKNDKLAKENPQLKTTIATMLNIAEEATVKAKAEHDADELQIQGLISQKDKLQSKLNVELENERVLIRENSKLKEKIAKLLDIAEKATTQAQAEQIEKSKKMQKLLSEYKALKSDLKDKLRKEQSLVRNNSRLKDKITKLLSIAEQATIKAQADDDAKSKKMQELVTEQKALKAELKAELRDNRALIKENSHLKNKIAKLLSIAEKATIEAQSENGSDPKEMKTLLLQQKELTSKLNQQNSLMDENYKLKETITKLLAIAEQATTKAQAEDSEKAKKMQTLLSQQQKLTAKLDNHELIKDENSKLKDSIRRLLEIAEKATNKARIEDEIKAKEMQSLSSENSVLRSEIANLSALVKDAITTAKEITDEMKLSKELESGLKATIAKLLSIAEEATTKAVAEHDIKVKEMQGLLAKQKNLESNLTSQIESKELLAEENANLQAILASLLLQYHVQQLL